MKKICKEIHTHIYTSGNTIQGQILDWGGGKEGGEGGEGFAGIQNFVLHQSIKGEGEFSTHTPQQSVYILHSPPL